MHSYLISESSFNDLRMNRMIPFYGNISAKACVNSLDYFGIQ